MATSLAAPSSKKGRNRRATLFFFFDASALVKRYVRESGSELVNFLFANVPLKRLKCLTLGGAEVFWICVRKKNDGRITPQQFTQAVANLQLEVIADDSDFQTISIPDSLVWDSLDLVETYSLNSVDGIVLRSALDVASELRETSNNLVLVASDKRLLRAARAEGLLTFNPESDTAKTLLRWLVIP